MTTHDVKIEPRWFERIRLNEKFAEVRYDDRDYQTGDQIRFQRSDCDGTRGWHFVQRTITHVLRSFEAIDDGYVVLSLADPRVESQQLELYRLREENGTLVRSNRALRARAHRLAEQVKA